MRSSKLHPIRPLLVAVGAGAALLAAGPASAATAHHAGGIPGYASKMIKLGSGCSPTGIAVNSKTDTIYVVGQGSPNIQAKAGLWVINGRTAALSTSIPLTNGPTFRGTVAVDPDTNMVYIAVWNGSSSVVTVVNGATNTVVDTISLLPAYSAPLGIAVDPVTDMIYVSENNSSALAVIDGATNTVTDTISLGSNLDPLQVGVDTATDTVYVNDFNGGYLSVIDGRTDTLTNTLELPGGQADDMAVDSATDTIYAAGVTGSLSVINGRTDAGSSVAGEGGTTVAVDQASDTIYTSIGGYFNFPGVVIDGATDKIVATLPHAGYAMAADPATHFIYATVGDAVDVGGNLIDYGYVWAMVKGFSPWISSRASITFKTRAKNEFLIVSHGSPAATVTESGKLPYGIRFRANRNGTATLSGTPGLRTKGKLFIIRFIATNGVGRAAVQRFTLRIG